MDDVPLPAPKVARSLARIRAEVQFTVAGCSANRCATGLGQHDPARDSQGNIYCVACGLIASVPTTDSRGRMDKARPLVSDDQRAQNGEDSVSKQALRRARARARAALIIPEGAPECRYCRSPLTDASRTKEHLRPISRGGAKDPVNIADACSFCNGLKGPLTDREFLLWLETGEIATSVPAEYQRALARWTERGLRLIVLRARQSAADVNDEDVRAV